jgi:hypothetical protein
MLALPHNFKVVQAAITQTTNATVTGDTVCLKNVHKAWIVAHFLQSAGAHATTITPKVGIADGSATNAITFEANWWKNADVATTDTLTAQTAATTMACTGGVTTNQLIVIEIDVQDVVNQSNTYDWLSFTTATSSVANNRITAWYLLEMRYQQDTPPAVIS